MWDYTPVMEVGDKREIIVQLILLPFFVGDVNISGGVEVTVNSDLNGDSPQFTLTCISTGGPATTVTWTRDSTTVTEGTETVLDDPVTAQYTHTLTVTGRRPGTYTCTLENNKPSIDLATVTLTGNIFLIHWRCSACDFSLSDTTAPSPPSDVTAVQAGITSITVTWTASSNATGYRIYYTSDGDSGSETVSGGSTETHTLTGLVNGETYTISVAATSQHFPSEAIAANATVSLRKYFVFCPVEY